MPKIHCRKCGQVFDRQNKETGIESLYCPFCGFDNKAADRGITPRPAPPDGEPEAQAPRRVPCAWEVEWKTNPFNAFIHTVKGVLTRPIAFFTTLKPFSDLFSLALFIFINSFVATLASMTYQFVFGAMINPLALVGIPFIVCGAVIAPLIVTVIYFLVGAVLHLFFNIVGGSEKGFNTTMSVYGLGSAAMLFGIIPFIGGLINLVYTIIINIFGQAEAHQISAGRAFFSFLVATLLVLFCVIGLAVLGIIALTGAVFLEKFN